MLRVAVLLTLLGALAAGCGGGSQTHRFDVVLDFTPNAAHAGIYEAVASGADRRRGIRLVVRQPTATSDSLALLANGRADAAIADIHDLALARERGEDLVGVGALVQRPLAAVIASPSVARPRALAGMRVGVTGVPSDNAVLDSVVSGDGGDPRGVRTITIGFDAVQSLLAGRVSAATAFWDVEGVTLRRHGFRPHEFRVDAYGAPRYPELVVVVRRAELSRERARVVAMLGALEAGTRTALSQPRAAVEQVARAGQTDPALVAAELAALRPALTPPLRLDPHVLARWAAFDVRFGILRHPPDIGRTFALGVAP